MPIGGHFPALRQLHLRRISEPFSVQLSARHMFDRRRLIHWQAWTAQMSALPPIADICSAQGDVCFVPIADIPPFKRRQLDYTSMTY